MKKTISILYVFFLLSFNIEAVEKQPVPLGMAIEKWLPGISLEKVLEINADTNTPEIIRVDRFCEEFKEESFGEIYRVGIINENITYDWYGMVLQGDSVTYLEDVDDCLDEFRRMILPRNNVELENVLRLVEIFGWINGYKIIGSADLNGGESEEILIRKVNEEWIIKCKFYNKQSQPKIEAMFTVGTEGVSYRILNKYAPYVE